MKSIILVIVFMSTSIILMMFCFFEWIGRTSIPMEELLFLFVKAFSGGLIATAVTAVYILPTKKSA